MNDLISVIVPVYNVEKYLNKCVVSIINQSYKNLEIILVDDGSTDDSGELCDSLAKEDSRITVIHKKNGGLSSARNVGLDIAKGDYVGFVDSDDYISTEMYCKLLDKMKQYNADISICNRWYELDNGEQFLRYNLRKDDLIMNSETAISEMNSYRSFDMAAWDKLYKRELFEKIRFPEGKLSEDFYIMYKLFDIAETICYTPEPLYFYIQRPGSISRNKHINHDFMRAAKEQMEYVELKYPILADCVHNAYASANMTVYNFYRKNRVPCTKEVKYILKKNVKDNLNHIKSFQNLSWIKKWQAYLFVYCIPIYNVMFYFYKKLDRI